MSVSNTESSASSFSSAGGSSIASDNTDSRALNALQSSPEEDNGDGVESNNRSIQEAVFATIYTLTMNSAQDSSVRLAVLKVVLEFLQVFRLLFNSTWAWSIQQDLWIYKAIQWILFRQLLLPKGYDSYVAFFYFLTGLILSSIAATAWVAVVLKGDNASNVWVKRLIGVLQTFAMVIYTIFWVAILDYGIFFFDCQWTDLAQGLPAYHIHFTDKNCLAMPHIAHMMSAGILCVIFAGMTLVMSIGYTDLNPLTRNWLARSDPEASFKILALKMVIVVVVTGLDCFPRVQVVIVLLAVSGVFLYHLIELPYYVFWTNLAWTGLWAGLLALACSLLNLTFTLEQHSLDSNYAATQTMAVLYVVLFGTGVGGAVLWARYQFLRRASVPLHASFEERKQLALSSVSGADVKARAAGSFIVTMMGELKRVYRYKDARQVSVLSRDMRKWDEDGIPDPDAAEYGEFVLKSGMARMPNDPALLVMYASFLIEVRKDGQAARTQLQLAQKANPSWLDNLNIYVAQQLAKQLKRDGDGLDLMGYVEYQRNYRACVRVHKLALMAQRAFWNGLLRGDKIPFKDMQQCLKLMEDTEARATATYRRVLERYPNNGRLLKVYGRFLEYVRNDPWTASKFYAEALKQGTTDSLLNLTKGQTDGDVSAAGSINEKVDGLIIINAQGVVMMINAAAVVMFGYEKGELEGKNVNVLMPQPFSSQHNTFIQRYTDTRVPHILDTTRVMVGLHKDRSMFPISLCATRLAGMGSETLFMGVVRRAPPASAGGIDIVRFWTTSTGLILCADASAADCFGLSTAELVGQPFANLCTDVEGANRFIAEAGDAAVATEGVAYGVVVQAQILHTYLPAVHVELSIESGGSVEKGSDARLLVIQVRLLSERQATLALDYKGRVVYATDKLSTMLGYPTATLTKMELNALLPPPYCQMHGAWFKDGTRKAGATSCRSGAVVHLLAANGTKVPVTLRMSTKEASDSKHSLHIIQVTKSSDTEGLNQQRLLLDVNHKGVTLTVNQGVQQGLFGFHPSELIGRPLASVVDVFGLWRHKNGEDNSLLVLLASQALKHAGGAGGGSHGSAASWRVGIHQPVKDDDKIASHAAQLANEDKQNKGSEDASYDLLHVLQQRNRLIPACLSVEMLQPDEELLENPEKADVVPVMQVSLFRSDALTAIIELDKHLGIARADDSAGLMFGVSTKHLLHKSFPVLMGLSPSTSFEDLLGTRGHTAGKKGAMKSASTATSRMGLVKKVTVHHLGDGKPLTLEMQAMSYDQSGKSRMLVRLQLQEACSASMPALLQLKEGDDAAEAAAAKRSLADAEALHTEGAGLQRADSHDSQLSDGGEGKVQGRIPLGQGPTVESFKRTSEWVRETSKLPKSPTRQAGGVDAADEPPHSHHSKHYQQHANDMEEAVYASVKRGGEQGRDHKWTGKHTVEADATEASKGRWKAERSRENRLREDTSSADDWEGGVRLPNRPGIAAGSGPGTVAESASVGGSASVGDGQSEAGGGSMSSAAETGHDEDLAVDARRAKRLKKLNRLVQSSVAQAAPNRWRRHTLALLATVLAAHVVCFAVLTLQIDDRYKNANDVANVARALDRFQNTVLRSEYIQKCLLDQFRNFSTCSDAGMHEHMSRLQTMYGAAAMYHSELYLGASGVQQFVDQRLLDYWTYHKLPERRFFDVVLLENGTVSYDTVLSGDRTLWEMGNVLIAAAKDVHFNALTLGPRLGDYYSYQYVQLNGPTSLFQGYSWSLDTFVDYAWQDLLTLSINIIVLLVVEVVVVLLSCLAYEFYLLQQCNVSHMRLFSIFLALPSATVRLMAQRQLPVDDETKDDMEGDELDLANDAAAGAPVATAGAADGANDDKPAATEKKKSVRVVVDDASSDEEAKSPRAGQTRSKKDKADAEDAEGRFSGRQKSKAAASKAPKKPTLTGFAGFKKSTYKFMFGWMDPKFKRNGKKLVADNRAVFRVMAPLLVWMIAVVVIFVVSFSRLQGLQGPLASLDTSAHVLYRLARSRLMSGFLAFGASAADNDFYRTQLRQELAYFRQEYATLMYGGDMLLQANVSFKPVAPAAVFSDVAVANLFFKTRDCLRKDQSLCITSQDDSFCEITHSGLDALINRYLDEMTAFSQLPDELSWANHSTFEWSRRVSGNDLYDGMQTASELFVAGTIAKFEGVKVLHIILLVASLVSMLLFVAVLYRPYSELLRHHSKAIAGMLSQLPAEVDVEGQVKAVVLGMATKPAGAAVSGAATLGPGRPEGFGMGMAGGVMQQTGGMLVPAGAMGMQLGAPTAAGMPAPGFQYNGMAERGGTWFGQGNEQRGPRMNEGNMGYY